MASYIDQVLIAGEHVVHQGTPSKWGDWPLWLFGVLLLPAFGVGLILLLIAYVRMKSTELAITNKRIIAKFGFIQRNTTEIQLGKVESIHVEQGILARLLNYGTIIVNGTGASFAPIPNITDPLLFRKKFTEAIDQLKP
jgi:uncharacterized membrane protein YdbT with pleckstrin-like domain